ncbi:lysoplasmalogenase family protein [Zhouia amylolytica]|uniref:lysoplasmalogenase family protein n=1 Tax=Zhouia amylolytica TaxID=376730 RepID=UPI0020CDFA70|nr:lysoplasmalogenase family protein [Zhouia amylolytica]MCQ0110842.1 hypothetical protein [Zhouia amylolytica]
MIKQKLTYVFIAVAVLYLLAEFFQLKLLISIAKVSLIPVVYIIYTSSKKKHHLYTLTLLIFYFLGDMFSLLNFNGAVELTLLFFGLGHLVFIRFCFEMLQDVRVRRLLFSALPVIVLWFIYYNYSIKDIFGDQLGDLLTPVMFYSIILSAFTVVSIMSYFNKENKMTMYTLIIAMTFLVGDVINGINMYFSHNSFFELTNVIAQVIAYYFLTKFIVAYDFKLKS